MARRRPLAVRHLVPGLGRVPRDTNVEATSGLVGSALALARAQAASGSTVEVFGWRPEKSETSYAFGRVAVRVTRGWSWARTRRVDLRVIAPLLAMSATSAPADVAHIHSEPHLLLAPRARLRVLHFQTPVPDLSVGLYPLLLRRAGLVVCCSEFVRNEFLTRCSYPEQRVVVVHNGVDLDSHRSVSGGVERVRLSIGPAETVVLFAGAVVPQKGLLPLMRALARLSVEQPWRLLVAGSASLWPTPDNPTPDDSDEYTALVRDASRGLPVTWLGQVPGARMPAVYAAADICVCPSVWPDPFPLVALEAMAAGKPVLASRTGGIPEAVIDGLTGILTPPGDEPMLADALAALIQDPGRRELMGSAARSRAASFTWERTAAEVEHAYLDALRPTA